MNAPARKRRGEPCSPGEGSCGSRFEWSPPVVSPPRSSPPPRGRHPRPRRPSRRRRVRTRRGVQRRRPDARLPQLRQLRGGASGYGRPHERAAPRRGVAAGPLVRRGVARLGRRVLQGRRHELDAQPPAVQRLLPRVRFRRPLPGLPAGLRPVGLHRPGRPGKSFRQHRVLRLRLVRLQRLQGRSRREPQRRRRSGLLRRRPTWSHVQTLIADACDNVPSPCNAANVPFNDKESVTADPTRPGVAYAVWDRLTVPRSSPRGFVHERAYKGPTMLSKTTDYGVTWSAPRSPSATAVPGPDDRQRHRRRPLGDALRLLRPHPERVEQGRQPR